MVKRDSGFNSLVSYSDEKIRLFTENITAKEEIENEILSALILFQPEFESKLTVASVEKITQLSTMIDYKIMGLQNSTIFHVVQLCHQNYMYTHQKEMRYLVKQERVPILVHLFIQHKTKQLLVNMALLKFRVVLASIIVILMHGIIKQPQIHII